MVVLVVASSLAGCERPPANEPAPIGRTLVNADSARYLPAVTLAAGAQPLVRDTSCLPARTVSGWPIAVTAAGVGVPVPTSFREMKADLEPGVSFEDRRAWLWTGVGYLTYKIVPDSQLRADHAHETVQKEAYDVRVCDTRVGGQAARVVAYSLPPGFVRSGPADVAYAWIPIDGARTMRLYGDGMAGLRDTILAVIRGLRLGLPPSHAEFPHQVPLRPAAISPDSIPTGDSIAYRDRFRLDNGMDTLYSIALYSTVTADVVHLERRSRDSVHVLARLRLPPEIRAESHELYSVCKVNGKFDPGVFGFVPRGQETRRPVAAWRAHGDEGRFEPLPARTVDCEMFDEGGDDGPPTALLP